MSTASRPDRPLLTERQAVVAACQRLSREGLVVGTAGNVSIRVQDLVVISPSGVDYATMTAADVGVHRLDGSPLDAPLRPSSELPLHLAVYRDQDCAAIVHTHSPASTALSVVVEEVPVSHYYTALFGGPIRVAPYATFGTDELARGVVAALAGRSAALMGNHGAVLVGADLAAVMSMVAYLEYVCDVALRVAATGLPPRLLPAAEVERVRTALTGYGQRSTSTGEA